MEDENGIELSLGLSCGGSSSKSKAKVGPSDSKTVEGNRNRSMGGNLNVPEVSFKPFFPTSIENLDSNRKQMNDSGRQQHENFWTDLRQPSSMEAEGPRFRELWLSNGKVAEVEEEKSGSNKRKLPFEEINLQNKQERGVDHIGMRGKSPTAVGLKSHVSVTTEDGSSGENEDVAESEAEGSTSWLASQHEENIKGPDKSKASDNCFLTDPSMIGSQRLKQPNLPGTESSHEHGKLTYGIPLSLQPLPVMNAPYSVPAKVPTISSAPNTSGFPSPCVMQLMPLVDNEPPSVQSTSSRSLQLAFGFSSVQLPTLEPNSSWVLGSQSQHVPAYGGRSHGDRVTNMENDLKISHVQASLNFSPALACEGKVSDLAKGNGKNAEETGTSSQMDEEAKGSNLMFRSKETVKEPVVEGFPREGSNIRPGIATNLKFGGSGSHPDLPWVSTTGSNGKTISGVTYKYSENLIKIVCACHAYHLTPDEFDQHANSDAINTENNTGLASFPNGNAAASAHS